MTSLFALFILIAFSQKHKYAFDERIYYQSREAIQIKDSSSWKLEKIASLIKMDSLFSFEILIVNEFYVDFEDSYEIDKKRVQWICENLINLGVDKNQCICEMFNNKVKLVMSKKESRYFKRRTAKDKDYIFKEKVLIVRKLNRIK